MLTSLTTALELGKNRQEILPEGDLQQLPYLCHYDDSEKILGNKIPWHWHSMVEVTYVEKGCMLFRAADEQFEVKTGEVLFVNANILHSFKYLESTRSYANLFDTRMLSGAVNSVFEQKYFTPILRCNEMAAWRIRPDSPLRVRMIGHLLDAVDALRDEPFGYEFLVRDALGRFWLDFYKDTEEIWQNSTVRNDLDAERMKQMLQYIYDHYMERITLAEISAAAGIGERECMRCFNRALGFTPIHYLTEYRVEKAAQLLQQTDKSISLIAEECGFASDSYFGKVLRKSTGRSPREYREQ